MLLNCGVGKDSWESLGLQGDPTSQSETPILWPPDAQSDSLEKTLAGKTEGRGEQDDRGWDGWIASSTQWTWVWAVSRSWWWTGKSGVLQTMGLQSVRHYWATELTELIPSSLFITFPCSISFKSLDTAWTSMLFYLCTFIVCLPLTLL